MGKRVTPEGPIYGQNSKFWQFWGLYSHISAPINVKFGTGSEPGERTFGSLPVPNFTFIGAMCHPCGANLGPLSKNNRLLIMVNTRSVGLNETGCSEWTILVCRPTALDNSTNTYKQTQVQSSLEICFSRSKIKILEVSLKPSAGDTISPAYNIWSSGFFSSQSDVLELTAHKLAWPSFVTK